MNDTEHVPVRPGWTCKLCGQEWPCPPRKAELVAECRRTKSTSSAHLYLVLHFIDAAADLPKQPSGALRQRFVAWLDVELYGSGPRSGWVPVLDKP